MNGRQKEPQKRGNSILFNFIFVCIFTVITFLQTFYWLFANQVTPIIFGLPFSMFFVTGLVVIEFVALVLLYRLENK